MRKHDLTAISDDQSRLSLSHDRLTIVVGNALNPTNVAEIVKGHDTVISTVDLVTMIQIRFWHTTFFIKAAHSLIAGLTRARVLRLVVVGGAGSLEVAPIAAC